MHQRPLGARAQHEPDRPRCGEFESAAVDGRSAQIAAVQRTDRFDPRHTFVPLIRSVRATQLDTSPLGDYVKYPCGARPWTSAGGFAASASVNTRPTSVTTRSTQMCC